jgi:hypothetical protein
MAEHLARLAEDQPPVCDCFSDGFLPHKTWCTLVIRDLVPGYGSTADGLADARDQREAGSR